MIKTSKTIRETQKFLIPDKEFFFLTGQIHLLALNCQFIKGKKRIVSTYLLQVLQKYLMFTKLIAIEMHHVTTSI